jgi:hypothetical protein
MTRQGRPVVEYLMDRQVDESVTYQRYYLLGLERQARLVVRGQPHVTRLLPGIDRKLVFLRRQTDMRRRLGRLPVWRGGIGRYRARVDGREVRFAVDANDSHVIHDPDALEWSEILFKANAWPEVEYDPRVLPIVNGNGILGRSSLKRLRALRGRERDIDVTFIVNVWGGREHNVRIFEELARLRCRKELLAVFPPPLDEEAERLKERLRRVNVPVADSPIAPEKLWDTLSRSRLTMFRSGRHLCIPWRMIDVLCMGCCVLLDAPPIPRWPVPLEPNVHYVDCGIVRPAFEPVADGEYDKVRLAIEAALADPAWMEDVRQNAIRYFEEHAAPERVADYVLARLRASAPGAAERAG